MFNIFNIAWYRCNFKTYGRGLIEKLHSIDNIDESIFAEKFGSRVIDRCQFVGAYNDIITDAYESVVLQRDNFNFFMTDDGTLWIEQNGIHGLKWLVCGITTAYVLSQTCKLECYKHVEQLGIYSPSQVYTLDINDISDTILYNICIENIGYLPVSNKSLWRDSTGTNMEKHRILFEYYKGSMPRDIRPPRNESKIQQIEDTNSSILLPDSIANELATMKRKEYSFRQEDWHGIDIGYISDIHLDYPGKLNDTSIDKQIKEICKELAQSASYINVILGDTCGNINLAQKFYHFLRIRMAYNQKKKNERFWVPAMSKEYAEQKYFDELRDIEEHLAISEKRFERAKDHFGLKKSIEWLIEHDDTDAYYEHYVVVQEYKKMQYIKRKLERFISEKDQYICDLQEGKRISTIPNKKVYIVLGNHELSQFNHVDEALDKYNQMLTKEHMTLLHNSAVYLESAILFGGVGFAKYNKKYNSNSLVGAKTMTRDEEIIESEKYYKKYCEYLQEAKERNIPLITCSHYPTKDWLPDNKYDSFSYYMWGHNHQNYAKQKEGINIISNNQVGYENKPIVFKLGYIGTVRNPFIDYKDGCYIITLSLYTNFMTYTGKSIAGTSILERALLKEGAKMYMIKAAGFYGFFILAPKSVAQICYGGRVTNIAGTKDKDIRYFLQYFIIMAKLQTGAFDKYFDYLKGISDEVKQMGFSGNIHGCIIDLDFYNHIMINPIDGKLTFYYSPSFGVVEAYDSFYALLEDSIKKTYHDYQYKRIVNKYDEFITNPSTLITKQKMDSNPSGLRNVTKTFGAYAVSNRMNRIQYFIESGVLNTWSMDAIKDFVSDVDLLDAN